MSTQPQPQHRPVKSADLDQLKQQQLDATISDDGRGEIAHIAGNTSAGKKAGYELPATEQHLLHVELVQFAQIPRSREFDRVAKMVQLSPTEFERMEKNDSFAEYQQEDNPGEVNILHDPRSKVRQKADQTGDVATGSPAEANKPLASLQDAQMRYRELTKQDAPTDKTFEELLELIAPLEAALKAESSTPAGATVPTKPLRIKADYVARYEELAALAPNLPEDLRKAPAAATVDELRKAIADLEAGAGK